MTLRAPLLSSRLQGLGTTIFAEMSALAERTGAINLGQGFPDTDGPVEVSEAAVAAIRSGQNQYPPGLGTSELRDAIARHQRRFWGLQFDPEREVLVTAGATEAITATMLALCEPGDEVICLEPTYDSYQAAAAMAGARLKLVRLDAPDYRLDIEKFRAAVSPRTRMVLINSPHNPTGTVLTADELGAIAQVCVEFDLLAVTDEVYEHIVFDGEHRPLATFPDMADRTLTISSAGKTFAFTGWKIGWACGGPELIAAVRTAKQFLTYVNGAPFQHAVAVGLDLGDEFFASVSRDLAVRRDILCEGLLTAGFGLTRPQGTYFVTADIRPLGHSDGVEFCRSLPELCGVVAVPSAVFYEDRSQVAHLVRFAFCKQPDVLAEAASRLATL